MASEIIVEFPAPLTDKEKKMIYGYKGEVVRCFDCKYFQWNMRTSGTVPLALDEFECKHWGGSCDPIGFCAWGERREDET